MKQLSFAVPEPKRRRGGPGRKPRRPGTWVKHRTRPWHDANHPAHVTLKVRPGIPNLRGFKLAKVIVAGLRKAATSAAPARVERRRSFRVVHFSVQPNHLHLIVEASSKTALARGMQGLASGLARRVNHSLGRRGSLFGDRYHAHAMSSPTEVRNAILYVLENYEKHSVPVDDAWLRPVHGVEPCSSGPWFEDWAESLSPPDAPTLPGQPTADPQTWLLRVGWKRSGLLHRYEGPRVSRPSSSSRPAPRPGAS